MIRYFLPLFTLVLTACGGRNTPSRPMQAMEPAVVETVEVTTQDPAPEVRPAVSFTGRRLDSLGYVNIAALDPTIAVEIVYATPHNFTGETLYEDLVEAYLLPEAAEKLLRSHELLKEQFPEYRFIVYDAARPMAVQRRMWRVAVQAGKQYYVANPANGGGLHNYGAAVDLSILDENGEPLPMGTPYDHFGPEANTDREQELVRQGKLTDEELRNRLLLREVMRAAGFRTVTSEWWHFNHCSRDEAKSRYPLIDF